MLDAGSAHPPRYEIRNALTMSFRPSERSKRVEESVGWLPHRFLDSAFGLASNDNGEPSLIGRPIPGVGYRYRYRYRYRMAGLEWGTSIAIAIPIAIAITHPMHCHLLFWRSAPGHGELQMTSLSGLLIVVHASRVHIGCIRRPPAHPASGRDFRLRGDPYLSSLPERSHP